MAYLCKACGLKTKRASATGTCPACSSASLARVKTTAVSEKKKAEKTKIEIAIMILLWSLLLYGLYDKFIA